MTAHDRVHAVGLDTLLKTVVGRWDAFADLAAETEAAVAANEDRPCQFNWRSLIVCALGLARAGNERDARRLEEAGRSTAVVAGPPEREPALLRLALLRDDLDEAARILERLPVADAWGLDAAAARLDALVALGDRERVEEEGEPFLERESYTRPFALRALGVVRGRRGLIDDAAAQFEEMGLAWRAVETRAIALPARANR